jgi:hypothetical protein
VTRIVSHNEPLTGVELGTFPENDFPAPQDVAAQNLLDDTPAFLASLTLDPLEGRIQLILGDQTRMDRSIRESEVQAAHRVIDAGDRIAGQAVQQRQGVLDVLVGDLREAGGRFSAHARKSSYSMGYA